MQTGCPVLKFFPIPSPQKEICFPQWNFSEWDFSMLLVPQGPSCLRDAMAIRSPSLVDPTAWRARHAGPLPGHGVVPLSPDWLLLLPPEVIVGKCVDLFKLT